MKLKRKIIVLTIIFACAIGIVLYPFFANIYNNYLAELKVVEYKENVADTDPEILADALKAAQEYNEAILSSNFSEDDYDYDSLLNLNGDGIMGSISIPAIDVVLPIYHGTSDDVLSKGVGHIDTSSLPVGGSSTHTVLSGHRGVPGSKLFTDLDKLEIGDMFYITVLGETLAYEVTEIQTVLPTETEALGIRTGEDLCTLVTCTPYGINSHRLLVTGTRVDYVEGEEEEITSETSVFSLDYILLYAAAFELLLYLLILFTLLRRNKKAA